MKVNNTFSISCLEKKELNVIAFLNFALSIYQFIIISSFYIKHVDDAKRVRFNFANQHDETF